MTKRQKSKDKYKKIGKVDANKGIKKKPKSLIQEELDIHEAYQLLLSEYHKRVKQRTKQKISMIAALSKKDPESTPTSSTNGNGNKNDADTAKNLARLVTKTTKSEDKPGRSNGIVL